jgi:chromate reductase, NAD(P)H dehydrogenase (quinone)
MADKALDVIAICGSLRKGSFNHMIINLLPGWAPAEMKITEAPPWAEFPLYNADIQNSTGFPPPVQKLAEAIHAADGVIFVSPEYNYSIPGGMKNAIDWVSRVPNQPFAGKPIAMISATGGLLGGGRMQYDLRRCMIFLDALTMNKPEVFIGGAAQKFDEKTGQLKDEQAVGFIKQQLAAFAKFIVQYGRKS